VLLSVFSKQFSFPAYFGFRPKVPVRTLIWLSSSSHLVIVRCIQLLRSQRVFLSLCAWASFSQIAARRQAAAIGIESVCRVHRSPASFVSRTPGSIRDFLPGPLAAPRLLPAWTRVPPPGFPFFFVCADLFFIGVLQLISSPRCARLSRCRFQPAFFSSLHWH
jgi:hypothetical protein